ADGLLVREHHADRALVRRVHPGRAAQVSLALGVLLGEDVAQERLAPLEPAAGELLEALGRAALGLQLRHDDSCIFFSLAPGASSSLSDLAPRQAAKGVWRPK